MTNKRIAVSELDFEGIRGNLKQFLQGQDRFKDYDYEGSNMAILLDLLAYNTHYNSLYTNMAINEVFLDSASKRSSVVSIAAALGYTPKGRTASRVNLSLTIIDVPNSPPLVTLPRFSKFITLKDEVRYTFNTVQEYSAARDAQGRYIFDNIEALEGTPGQMRWVVTDSTRFVIPSNSVDSSTLRVRVDDSAAYQNFEFFVEADREMKIDGSSKVYFLRETFEGNTELLFGDGVFGASLQAGNIVTVDYLVTNGAAANDIKRGFSAQTNIPGTLQTLVVLSSDKGGSYGGAEREGIDEIRHNAPNLYASQGRAVTERDYEALITEKVPTIVQCACWGGEKNTPPVYGKVFICAKTANNQPLTYAEREYITREIIDPLKVVSSVTEFVDPTYIRVIPDIRVYWDPNKTSSSDSEIEAYSRQVVEQYTRNELERFNRVFRRTQVSRLIELCDPGVNSAVVRIRIGFEITPSFNFSTNYTIATGNPWVQGTLSSEPFYIANAQDSIGVLRQLYVDDANGVVRIYWVENGARVYYNRNAGTVDYSTGTLNLKSLNVYNATSANLKFYVSPVSDDVAGFNHNVIVVDTHNTKIQSIRDSAAMREGGQFVFSSSRV